MPRRKPARNKVLEAKDPPKSHVARGLDRVAIARIAAEHGLSGSPEPRARPDGKALARLAKIVGAKRPKA